MMWVALGCLAGALVLGIWIYRQGEWIDPGALADPDVDTAIEQVRRALAAERGWL